MKTSNAAPDKNQKSLAGEFAVLSQLAMIGLNASMTLGRTKSIDILIHNPKTNKFFKMEVKTALKNNKNKHTKSKDFGKTFHWDFMNKKHEKIKDPDLFYCFVLLSDDIRKFRFFHGACRNRCGLCKERT